MRRLSLLPLVLVAALLVASLASVAFANEKTRLEIMAFEGGYGVQWLKDIAQSFEALHPDVEVVITSNPRIWEQVRPRFIAGNPPDVVSPGWGFDIWGAIYEGQVLPLTKAMNSPAYGSKAAWKDTFLPGALAGGMMGKEIYIMPLFYDIDGWYYDANLFAKKGFTVPKSLSELEALGDKAKKAGIALFSNQGVYPYYALWNHFFAYVFRIGGPKVYENLVNLVPGAWTDPAVTKAAELIRQFQDKGYFQKGHTGMTHTEAQMEMILGHALINGAGTWLPNEMAKVTPPGVELRFMPVPDFPNGKGNGGIAASDNSATNWIVPAKAKHPELAIEFLKYMTSVENAKKIARTANAIVAIKGAEQALDSPAVKSALDALDKARYIYNLESTIYFWYPPLEKALEDNLTALFLGQITPKEFGEKIEAKAKEIREDKSIKKHTYEVVEK